MDDYTRGITFSYSTIDRTCPNGENVVSLNLNCSRHFDRKVNYTVTSLISNKCATTISINTPGGCPIVAKTEEMPMQGHRHNSTTLILMIFGIVGACVCICACCVACCVCRKVAREKCASRGGRWCGRKQNSQAPAQTAQQHQPKPAPAPKQIQSPRPPIQPPPTPQVPQVPGYFVPVGNPESAQMYPNLFQGGYMPLVPMMVQQPAIQNPFVQLDESHVQAREQQVAEDERLARLLQQQFNQQHV